MSGTDGYARRMLAVISLGTVGSVAGRMVLPAVLPTIIDAFAITPAEAGLALTALVAGIALCQYLGGRLSDDLSRKTVLVAALGLFLLGFAVLAVAPTYPLFLVGAAVVGMGHGLYLPATFAQLSELFTAGRGQAFGINGASFTLGSALGPALAVAVLAVAPWRTVFLPVVVLLAGVLVVQHRWNRDPYAVGSVSLDVRATAARLLAAGSIRRSLLAFALAGFVWQGGVNFIPTFLQVERGFSASFAGAVFAGLFVVGTVATPLAGRLGDRFDHPTVALAGLGVGLSGLAVLLVADSRPGAVAGVLGFGLGLSAFWPVMDAFVMERFPEGSKGGDFGALNTVNLAVGSLGPGYVGLVAGRSSYTAAFAGFLVPVVLAIAAIAAVRRSAGAR